MKRFPVRHTSFLTRTAVALSFCFWLAGCAFLGEDGPAALDGPYTDYDAYLNAELVPFPPFSARLLHFDGTRYLLAFRVECAALPVDSVHAVELLELESGIDLEAWVTYHNADFGNEYADVEPARHALRSGTVRLADVRVEEETRRYGERDITVQAVSYRLEAEGLLFDGGVAVPSVQTEQHTCYVGDGFGEALGS
ncbi:MAG: hypothetical protein ACR2GR_09735 [Rhodothermales bacterium]